MIDLEKNWVMYLVFLVVGLVLGYVVGAFLLPVSDGSQFTGDPELPDGSQVPGDQQLLPIPEDQFSLGACPQNMATENYYIRFITSDIYRRHYDYTIENYVNAFESEELNFVYTLAHSNDAEKQGIDIQRIDCYKAEGAGANVNEVYCGNSLDNKVRYTTPEMFDENGVLVQLGQDYEMKWIIDRRDCTFSEPIISDEYEGGWIDGVIIECPFKDLGCMEV